MMKHLLALGLVFGVSGTAWADCYLYRTNGGEVEGASVESYNLPAESYYSEVCNPPIPDGNNLVPTKIWDGAEVRNATAPEIASFPGFEALDELDRAKKQAKARYDDGNQNGIMLKAFALLVLDEVNLLRTRTEEIKGCISNANNLGSAKTCVDGLSVYGDRTKQQVINGIKAKIDADLAN